MKRKFVGLTAVICLLVILTGCAQIAQSETAVQSRDDAQDAPTVIGDIEGDIEETESTLVAEKATETLPADDPATKEDVEQADDEVTASKPNIELPKPQNQLSERRYSWNQLLTRDAILPIYEPEFAPAENAPYTDDELVIGVATNGEAKAYAIGPLNGREMVNDTVGGTPVLVTW